MKLDRLSALLEGLAPMVTVFTDAQAQLPVAPGPGHETTLQLLLLTRGEAQWETEAGQGRFVAPSLLARKAEHSQCPWGSAAAGADRLIRVEVRLNGPLGGLFLEAFPQPRALALSLGEPALSWAVAMIESELDAPRCGQPAVLNRAAEILFVGLLRHLVAHPGASGEGLFMALADPRIARAVVAMHQRPSFGWDLARLAQEAGMSRTAFATQFHAKMGRPPGRYLAAIRLALAQRAVDLGKGLKEAARVAGYDSSAALSRALAQSRGARPSPHRRVPHP